MLVLYSGCLGTIGVTRGMAGGLGTCQDAVGSDLEATRMWRYQHPPLSEGGVI